MKIATKEIFDKFCKREKHDEKLIVLCCDNQFDRYVLFYKLDNLGITWFSGSQMMIDYMLDDKNMDNAYCFDNSCGIEYTSIKWFQSEEGFEVYKFKPEMLEN